MSTKTIFLTALLSLFISFVQAQQFELPADFKLEKKEDYANYEKTVIEAAKWLEATPIDKEADKRQQVNVFMMKWITGSPTVTIELGKFHMDILDNNPQLLSMYLAAYARYVLENNYSKDKVQANVAAFKSVVNLYNLGGDFKKNKHLQRLITKDKDGKLEEWITKEL